MPTHDAISFSSKLVLLPALLPFYLRRGVAAAGLAILFLCAVVLNARPTLADTPATADDLGSSFEVIAEPEVDRCNPEGPVVTQTSFDDPGFASYSEPPVIPEEPVIALQFSCAVQTDSVAKGVSIMLDGAVESIGVNILTGEEREGALCKRNLCGRKDVVLVRPKLVLPFEAKGEILVEKIRSKTNFVSKSESRHEFSVRPRFTAELKCGETFSDGRCNPYLPIYLVFSEKPEINNHRIPALTSGEHRVTNQNYGAESSSLFRYYYSFKAPFTTDSIYSLELPKNTHDRSGRILPDAKRTLSIGTGPIPPLAKFSAPFGIVESAAGGILPVSLRRTEEALPVSITTLDTNSLFAAKDSTNSRIPQFLSALRGINREFQRPRYRLTGDLSASNPEPSYSKSIMPGDKTTDKALNRNGGGDGFEVAGIPLPGPGLHFVNVSSKRIGASYSTESQNVVIETAALSSNLAVHVKMGDDRSLVWVTELNSGQPAPKAEIVIYNCEGLALWTGVSDSQGMAWIEENLHPKLPSRSKCFPYDKELGYVTLDEKFTPNFTVLAQRNGEFGFALSSWNQGIESWRFQIYPYSSSQEDLTFHTILSRPLLRRGETVRMKHLARLKTMKGFDIPPSSQLPNVVNLVHNGSAEKISANLKWDPNGTAESEITLSALAKLGDYSIMLSRDNHYGTYSGGFSVEDYRLPTLKGSIQVISQQKVSGASDANAETKIPQAEISVQYLSGGGASSLPVKIRYQFEPYVFTFAGKHEDFVFNDHREDSLNRSFNNADIHSYEIDYAVDPRENQLPPQVRTKSVLLDQTGNARFQLDGLPTPKIAGQLRIDAEYRDPAGVFQSIQQTIPHVPGGVHVGIKLDSWANVKNQFKFQVATLSVDGKPLAGRTVRVSAFQRQVYTHRKKLIGGTYAYQNETIDQIPSEVCVTDTNQDGIGNCSIKLGISGNIVLVAETRSVDAPAQPVARTASSVWVANGDEWWFAQQDNDRIDFIPEKERYQPGETARFQVRMPFRDAQALVTVEREGVLDAFVQNISRAQPVIELPIKESYGPNIVVSALVLRGRVDGFQPTGMVDLGKPSIKLGMVPLRVGTRGYELKVNVKTQHQVYQVRDTVTGTVEVRTPDGKAPYARGLRDAEVALAVIDESLLELKPNKSWNLLDAMTGTRATTVQTFTSGMYVIGKRHFGQKALPFGGGGGLLRTREVFDPEVFWRARVPLDENGIANFEFPLKDTLSSFRIVAVATAGSYLFGTGKTSVRSTQDVMIVSGITPIARNGDQFPAEWTIRNTTDGDLDLQVSGSITGGPTPINIEAKKVTVRGGESKSILEKITVPEDTRELVYQLKAVTSDQKTADSIKVTQRVLPPIEATVQSSTLVQLTPAAPIVEKFFIPLTAITGSTIARVTVGASLVDSLQTVRDYMTRYPYSCLEQKVSRAIVLNDKLRWERIMSELPGYLSANGLACYFPGCMTGDDLLTSYVLRIASERNWEIPNTAQNKMLNALATVASGKGMTDFADQWMPREKVLRQISAVESLSRYGVATLSQLMPLWTEIRLLPDIALVQFYRAASTFKNLPEREQKLRYLSSLISSRLAASGTTVRLNGEGLSWMMEDAASVLAQLALVISRNEDSSNLKRDLPRIVRGLLEQQELGRWRLTTTNAYGTLALEKFRDLHEKGEVSGQTRINTSVVDSEGQSQPWNDKRELLFEKNVPSGETSVSMKHDGTGAPWATVSAIAAVSLVAPEFRGFELQRSIEPVAQREPGKYHVGDTVRVTLTIRSNALYKWVVATDPIPAGTSIVSGNVAADFWSADRIASQAFEERGDDSYRVYFDRFGSGDHSVSYVLRLNNSGTYRLSNARVEAMYSPEVFAEVPLKDITVEPVQ